jgi:hypothetical protein
VDQLRKERNEMQEENRRLVQLLKDNRKWDINIMQRENERLMKQLKEYENGGGGNYGSAIGPQSGENKNSSQKV